MLSWRQQLPLDSHYPARFRDVRQRILFEHLHRLRLARARRACILHVQKRHFQLSDEQNVGRELRLLPLIRNRTVSIRFRITEHPAEISAGCFLNSSITKTILTAVPTKTTPFRSAFLRPVALPHGHGRLIRIVLPKQPFPKNVTGKASLPQPSAYAALPNGHARLIRFVLSKQSFPKNATEKSLRRNRPPMLSFQAAMDVSSALCYRNSPSQKT